METTPLLASQESSEHLISSPTSTFRQRQSPTRRPSSAATNSIVTQISNMFSSTASPEAPSSPDIENIYSYLGESVIVTFMSICCLVTYNQNNFRLRSQLHY